MIMNCIRIFWYTNLVVFLSLMFYSVGSYMVTEDEVLFVTVPEKDTTHNISVSEEIPLAQEVLEGIRPEALAQGQIHPFYTVATKAFDKGKTKTAIKFIHKAIAEKPFEPILYNDLGVYYLSQEKYDLAEKAFQKSLLLNPSYARAYYNLGTLCLKQEKNQNAVHYLQMALQHEPFYTEASYNLGQAYSGLGQHKQAILQYEKVATNSKGSSSARALYNLGILHLEKNKLNKALSTFEKALKKKPR